MNKVLVKRIVFLLTLVILLSSTFATFVYAEDEELVVTPRWSIIYLMDLDIVFPAEGEGIVSAMVTGQPNVTRLEGNIRLYEYVDGSWMFMETFSNTSTYRSLGVEGYFDAVRGRAYKAYFYVTAYSSDDVERTYCKVEEVCP